MVWSTESRHERGYGSEWDKVRKLALERDFGMCQCKRCNGIGLPATHVHHIVSIAEARRRGWPTSEINALRNLESLNKACHDAEHKMTAKPVIGDDGYPI